MSPRQDAGSSRPRTTRAQAAFHGGRAVVLKELRRRHRLTQDRAALIAGVHGATWSRWERSKPAIEQLMLEAVVARVNTWAKRQRSHRAKKGGG